MSARFGSLVVLRDLVSKPELNGLRGTIKSLTAAGDRCEVVVEGAGAQHVSVRLANVLVVDTTDFSSGSKVTVVRVKVHSLESATQHNGLEVTRGSRLYNGRVQVVFDSGRLLSLKEENLKVVGDPIEGRLKGCDTGLRLPADDERWTVELSGLNSTVHLPRGTIKFSQLRPPDVAVPSRSGLQWSFDDLRGLLGSSLAGIKLSSTRATPGERCLENIRTVIDTRLVEFNDLSNAIATAARSASGDFLQKIALPNVHTWNGICRAEMPTTTISVTRAMEAFKKAEEHLISLRWEWERCRTVLRTAIFRDDHELRTYEVPASMLLSSLESHLEASLIHKQLALLGLQAADFDRLQGLVSPRCDSEWPEDLQHLDLDTESGRDGHLSALKALFDEFEIPPDQLSGRYVSCVSLRPTLNTKHLQH